MEQVEPPETPEQAAQRRIYEASWKKAGRIPPVFNPPPGYCVRAMPAETPEQVAQRRIEEAELARTLRASRRSAASRKQSGVRAMPAETPERAGDARGDAGAGGAAPLRVQDIRAGEVLDIPMENPIGGEVPSGSQNLAPVGPPSEMFEGRKRFLGAAESVETFSRAAVELDDFMKEFARDTKRFKRAPREGGRFESRRLEKYIQQKYGDWPEEYRRLATAALTVYNRRFGDYTSNEFLT